MPRPDLLRRHRNLRADPLPDSVYHSPVFQEIVLAGADLFSWINDLYSLDKEIACGLVSNLILALQRERRLYRERAFIAAHTLIIDRANDLIAAEQRLPELIDTLQLDTATSSATRPPHPPLPETASDR